MKIPSTNLMYERYPFLIARARLNTRGSMKGGVNNKDDQDYETLGASILEKKKKYCKSPVLNSIARSVQIDLHYYCIVCVCVDRSTI